MQLDWLHWTLLGIFAASEALPFIFKVRANGILDFLYRMMR